MKLTTALCLAAALLMPLALTACNEEGVGGLMAGGAKESRPIPAETLKLMAEKGMTPQDPILIRVFKEDDTLEIWKRDKTNHFALLKSYTMCAWGGTIGPKLVEGDKMSPEGFYEITPGRMNPNSHYYLAFDLGFPNAFDRAFNRTGSAVMVHGNCTGSAGCFVLTDYQVQEVYAIAREALAGGQTSFQVQAYPFRMTAANLAKHRRNPNMAFWRNLKEGYDHFEVTRAEPKVDVCDKKYVFDAHPVTADSTTFNATGACPTYKVPEEIAVAVASKQKADDADFKVQVAAIDAQERAQADTELAMKMEAAKPKKPPVDLLASIMPRSAPSSGPLATGPASAVATTPASAAPGQIPIAARPAVISTADAKPINVPVPKASPLDVAKPEVSSGYQATEKPAGNDVIGNFLSYVKMPDFGSKKEDPALQAQMQQASATASVSPAAANADEVAKLKTPAPLPKPTSTAVAVPATGKVMSTPLTAPPPVVTKVASTPPASATSAPVPVAAPATVAAPADTPWWKKLNPFGG
jgi:murein L,D-transpeptidase YafK